MNPGLKNSNEDRANDLAGLIDRDDDRIFSRLDGRRVVHGRKVGR